MAAVWNMNEWQTLKVIGIVQAGGKDTRKASAVALAVRWRGRDREENSRG